MFMYASTMEMAELLRDARQRDGVSQQALARRASTTQPAISLYESGRVTPEMSTLERLFGAAGFEMRITLVRAKSPRVRVLAMRESIRDLAAAHGLSNVKLFGSVAREDARPDSDIDLVVDPSETTSLFDTMEFAADVEELLGTGHRVDVASSRKLTRPVPEAITL